MLDISAILGKGVLHVFASNRSLGQTQKLTIKLAGVAMKAVSSAEVVTGPDARAANSFEQPDVVKKTALEGIEIADGEATLELPPLSFAAASFELASTN
jgi:alpha-N-arabinofuranosidase